MNKSSFILSVLVLAVTGSSLAAPIHSDVALTPATGTTIVRTQLRYTEASKSGMEKETLQIPLVVAHGFTGRFAMIVKVPYVEVHGSTPSKSGIADPALIGKIRFWQNDSTAMTDRATLLLGIETPWGESGFSSRSWDPILGITFTRQGLISSGRLLELNATLTHKINTENGGVNINDITRYDLAIGHQLWPSGTADRVLMGLLELNGSFVATEGSVLYLSPGLEWISRRWILEGGLQIPIVQNLKGSPFKTDYTAVAGVRTQF